MIAWDSQKPRVRLQLHQFRGYYFWQIRNMAGVLLVESPPYPDVYQAEEVIKTVEIEFDPLRVQWSSTTGVRP